MQRHKRVISAALSLVLVGLSTGVNPAFSAPHQLKAPVNMHLNKTVPSSGYGCEADTLLVMPNQKADKDDIKQTLEDVHGTVTGTIGEGALKVLIIRTEKGKLEQTEKALKKDAKDFTTIQRNWRAHSQQMAPNDTRFPEEWHLGAVNAVSAWSRSQGNREIGIFDSGCQATIDDLRGKTEKGINAWDAAAQIGGILGGLFGGPAGIATATALADATGGGGQNDQHGHGTEVATTAAATMNNGVNSVGVAPGATVVPIQIAGKDGWTEDIALIIGINYAMMHGIRIINISYQAPPPVGFTNAGIHSVLHAYLAAYFAQGGLTFMAAGNDNMYDPDPPLPYLCVVSAIDRSFSRASFSNVGNCITFTAPGKDIQCSNNGGAPVSVDGTSFASPICAGIAALVWNANPSLPNVGVLQIMQMSCSNSAPGWTPWYGFGLPDAEKAVRMAGG